jgi:hypothetical protein
MSVLQDWLNRVTSGAAANEETAQAVSQYNAPVGYQDGNKTVVMETDGTLFPLAGEPQGLDMFIALQAYADTAGRDILYRHPDGQLYAIPAGPKVAGLALVDPDAVLSMVSKWGLEL